MCSSTMYRFGCAVVIWRKILFTKQSDFVESAAYQFVGGIDEKPRDRMRRTLCAMIDIKIHTRSHPWGGFCLICANHGRML